MGEHATNILELNEFLFAARAMRWIVLALIIVCAFRASAAQKTHALADVIVVHGRIYTVDTKHPWASAVAILDEKIIAIGADNEILGYRGPATKVIDARGRLVLPGFTDCHAHFLDGSFTLQQLNLEGAGSLTKVQRRLKDYAAAHRDDPWLLGRGWIYPLFLPSGLPDKKYLDQIVSDRPVY